MSLGSFRFGLGAYYKLFGLGAWVGFVFDMDLEWWESLYRAVLEVLGSSRLVVKVLGLDGFGLE